MMQTFFEGPPVSLFPVLSRNSCSRITNLLFSEKSCCDLMPYLGQLELVYTLFQFLNLSGYSVSEDPQRNVANGPIAGLDCLEALLVAEPAE